MEANEAQLLDSMSEEKRAQYLQLKEAQNKLLNVLFVLIILFQISTIKSIENSTSTLKSKQHLKKRYQPECLFPISKINLYCVQSDE